MKIAFLFSGQGSQYSGMMRDLYEVNNRCYEVFSIADKTLRRSISNLCFYGSQEELNMTHNTQPCLLAADLAAYFAFTDYGLAPDAVAGFSLGEYAALVAAKAISIEDAFRIVQLRADAMQNAVPVGKGAMAAIMKLSVQEVQNLCDSVEGYVIPVNFNCPGQIVISGEAAAVDALVTNAKSNNIRVVKLPVSAPFHCKLMEPVVDILRKPLAEIVFSTPIYPVYMNVDAKQIETSDSIARKLLMQACSPVYWEQTLLNMYADGITGFIEFGPGNALTSFVNKTLPNALALHIENIETLSDSIKRIEELI